MGGRDILWRCEKEKEAAHTENTIIVWFKNIRAFSTDVFYSFIAVASWDPEDPLLTSFCVRRRADQTIDSLRLTLHAPGLLDAPETGHKSPLSHAAYSASTGRVPMSCTWTFGENEENGHRKSSSHFWGHSSRVLSIGEKSSFPSPRLLLCREATIRCRQMGRKPGRRLLGRFSHTGGVAMPPSRFHQHPPSGCSSSLPTTLGRSGIITLLLQIDASSLHCEWRGLGAVSVTLPWKEFVDGRHCRRGHRGRRRHSRHTDSSGGGGGESWTA